MTERQLEAIWDWWRGLDDTEQEQIIIKAYRQWKKFGFGGYEKKKKELRHGY
jgi:hypothetical protein